MKGSKFKKLSNNPSVLKIRQIWRIILYLSVSTSLGFLLVTKGWEAIDKNQIYIKGAIHTPREEILAAMKLNLPKAILEINPKQIEENIHRDLSLQAVSVNRRLAPLSLEVKIVERIPKAFALRRGKNGQEKGMIDEKGYWIPIFKSVQNKAPSLELIIDGWSQQNQKLISIILRNEKKLGSQLKRIIFKPNGNIVLQTADFLFIYLGNNPAVLKQQIKSIKQLSKSLPHELIQSSSTILDLKNHLKPKLFLPEEIDLSK